MEKKEIFTGIGIATLIIIIGYSIALFIYFENTIPGAGTEFNMAQELFKFQLVYIIPIGLLGIGLIYKENIEIKVRNILADNPLIEEIRNYFSDRIDEIEEGIYVPIFEQVKALPEFNEITRENFRIARRQWYFYYFGMSFYKFNLQPEKVK